MCCLTGYALCDGFFHSLINTGKPDLLTDELFGLHHSKMSFVRYVYYALTQRLWDDNAITAKNDSPEDITEISSFMRCSCTSSVLTFPVALAISLCHVFVRCAFLQLWEVSSVFTASSMSFKLTDSGMALVRTKFTCSSVSISDVVVGSSTLTKNFVDKGKRCVGVNQWKTVGG